MITGKDFYNVMAAVVPLYVAMILAYGSVRWWKLLSPDQCSGINRFVALFAVPLLSFQIIAHNNPYEMNVLFVAADGVQKLVFIVILAVWVWYSKWGSLDWFITYFMVATLPNTLVMGVPLLYAMYGPVHGNLVVQAVVLQCIVWYTLLLFLYEYRSARILIMDQFPDTAASIVSFKVDHDVMSLDGRDPVMTEAQIGEDGKLHVKVRKSTASAIDMLSLKSPMGSVMGTPRPSNLSNAEIYSLQSSRNMTPRDSSFNRNDYYLMMANKGNSSPIHQPSRLSESSYGLQSGLQSSSSREDIHPAAPRISYSRSQQRNYGDISHMHKEAPQAPASPNSKAKPGGRFDTDAKELHMFVWSSSASPTSERGLHCFGGNDYGVHDSATKEPKLVVLSPTEEVSMEVSSEGRNQVYEDHMDHDDFTFGTKQPEKLEKNESGSTAALTPRLPGKGRELPPASVMTKLILDMVWRKLIRNPNTYSSLLGLTWALISFRWHVSMPKIIEKSITILSDAGLGMAMFSLGLFMALQSRLLACGTKMAIIGMVVRFCAGPAVMSAASAVTGLRSLDLRAAIVQAALPQGIVPFVFAKEYNVHPDILSTAVIFGMLVALPITLLYYILLGI